MCLISLLLLFTSPFCTTQHRPGDLDFLMASLLHANGSDVVPALLTVLGALSEDCVIPPEDEPEKPEKPAASARYAAKHVGKAAAKDGSGAASSAAGASSAPKKAKAPRKVAQQVRGHGLCSCRLTSQSLACLQTAFPFDTGMLRALLPGIVQTHMLETSKYELMPLCPIASLLLDCSACAAPSSAAALRTSFSLCGAPVPLPIRFAACIDAMYLGSQPWPSFQRCLVSVLSDLVLLLPRYGRHAREFTELLSVILSEST